MGLNDIIAGAWSLGVDAGWYFTPHLYVGGFFTYGFGMIQGGATSVCPDDPDTSCGADLFRLGAVAEWHFTPEQAVRPVGARRLGWDVLNVEQTNNVDGSVNPSSALNGPFLSAGGGLDVKPGKYFGLGPYAELQVGHFLASDGFDLHGYLTGGIRLRTNL